MKLNQKVRVINKSDGKKVTIKAGIVAGVTTCGVLVHDPEEIGAKIEFAEFFAFKTPNGQEVV
jgi:hypothetical protein